MNTPSGHSVATDRLIIRPPVASDRRRFVELFTDEAFTVYAGVHDVDSANTRFDRMLALAAAVPYAKQPVIEKATGTIVGYTGVGTVVLDGADRLEWGWRFVPEARGRGYATEATTALLAVADADGDGEMLCIIDVENKPSRRVADKVGFRWWRRHVWPDDPTAPTDLLTRPIGLGGPPLLAPDLDERHLRAPSGDEEEVVSLGSGELVTETLGYDGGRQVTVYVPPDQPEAVVFAADGGWHIADLSEAVEHSGTTSTMIVGVHGLPDEDGRLREYVPGFDDGRFHANERFFVTDVATWLASRFGVALPAARTGVWGASLGAEFALAMGLRHPDVYGAVFSASPGAGYRPPPVLPNDLPFVYLVAGTGEPFFLDNATRWATALRTVDAAVVMVERDGTHGDPFWAEEFPLMVDRAFGN